MSLPRERVHGHWLRDRLLAEYASCDASPSEVARRVGHPLNVVSYHTRVLLEHGFLELVRTERRRGGTAHVYRALTDAVIEADEWMRLPGPVRRSLVRGVLAAVVDESLEAGRAGGFDSVDVGMGRWPVRLDDVARGQVIRLLEGLVGELQDIQTASDLRRASDRRRVDVVLMGFALKLTGRRDPPG